MDFIPFHQSHSNVQRNMSPNTLKQNLNNTRYNTPSAKTAQPHRPAFGSPAIPSPFGGPAFGSPAVTNNNFNPSLRAPSPRHYSPASPRHYSPASPRHYGQASPRQNSPRGGQSPYSNQFTSPYSSQNSSFEGRPFKTPNQTFPPSGNANRGSGRKSFTKQFGQTPRYDPNCNAGGSSNIEDYYHKSMVEDPWRFLKPTIMNVSS